MAIEAKSTGADWLKAPASERAEWGNRLTNAAKGDVALAKATVECIDEATSDGAQSGQSIAELSTLCMTMLESQREGRTKTIRDKVLGPSASPENKALLDAEGSNYAG